MANPDYCADWEKQIAEATGMEELRAIARDILKHGERQTRLVVWMANNDPRQSVCVGNTRYKKRLADFIESLDAS